MIYYVVLLMSLLISYPALSKQSKKKVENKVEKKYVNLSLPRAIDIAFKNNPEIKQVRAEHEIKEMEFELKKVLLYFPEITLNSSVSLTKGIANMHASSDGGAKSTAALTRGNTRSSSIMLEISELNIFNMGIDKTNLDIQKLNLEDARIFLKSKFRSFIIDVMSKYFVVILQRNQVENIETQLTFQNSMLELAKQKVKTGDAEEDEALYMETEILDIQKDLNVANFQLKTAMMDLNKTLYVNLDNEYIYTTDLTFTAANISQNKLKEKIKHAPELRRIKLRLAVEKKNVKLAWMNRLPLPTISIGGYNYGYSQSGDRAGKVNQFTGGRSGNQFDLRASINWSLPLFGQDGFLGSLSYKKTKVAYMATRFEVENTKRSIQFDMYTAYNELISQEQQITITKKSLESSSRLLDLTFSKYQKEKATRVELRDALDKLTTTNSQYFNLLLSYTFLKAGIARRLGEDNLLDSEVGVKK